MSGITMRDIGKKAGVSAVTVSKALAGKTGVSEDMRQKIIQIADEMGYVNPLSVQNREKRALDVGILVPEHFFGKDSFYAMFYKQLVQALTEAGHFALMELLDATEEEQLILPKLLRSSHVDGLIVLGQPSKEYMRMVAGESIPVVFLDFYDEQACADAVVGDNSYGCYRLTSHLIKNGHKDIGFLGNIRATSSIMDRYLGYYKAMLSHDLVIREECIVKDRENHQEFDTFVLPAKLPTAFVCNCDLMARRLINQLNAMGVRVPEDVSVVGFDDDSAGSSGSPALSTFRLDSAAMAQTAVRLIDDRCAGVQKPFGRVVVGGMPIYRESEIPLK